MLGRRDSGGGEREEGMYMVKARVMEKGYSLKSFLVASRVEACLRVGSHVERMFFFGVCRLMGSEEKLWKDD